MLLHIHGCVKLGLDDATCMCVSGVTSVVALVAFVLIAWWVGR